MDFTPLIPLIPQFRKGEPLNTARRETRLWSLLRQAVASQGADESTPAPALQDHTLWEDDFSRWALKCCLFRGRCFGGAKGLHAHFCDWCIAHELVPCQPETFAALLEYEGFLMASGMVSGLVLKEDTASCELWHQKTAPKTTGDHQNAKDGSR